MSRTKPKNPFYVLLMIFGTLFALTAGGYAVMTVRMTREAPVGPGDRFFDEYGLWIMFGELVVLAVLTFAAVLTDDYWTRAAEREGGGE